MKRPIDEKNAAYGFLPLEPGSQNNSPRPPFVTTGDFADLARNHCCATMLTNFLLLGYAGQDIPLTPKAATETAEKNRTEKKSSGTFSMECARELFSQIHSFVGNGPVFTLHGANRFLRHAGIRGKFRHISKQELYSLASAGKPAALLLAASPFDWHWVLAVGTSGSGSAGSEADTNNSDTGNSEANETASLRTAPPHLRIINNWEKNTCKTYIPDRGSRILAVWAFSPD